MKAIFVGRHSGRVGRRQEEVAAGLKKHGVETEFQESIRSFGGLSTLPAADFVVCWGWRKGAELQRLGYRVLVGELGYIGDRGHWTSLGWDGLNGRADHCLGEVSLPERFSLHHAPLEPWKEGGDYVLVMGQVPGDASLQGRCLDGWYSETLKQAADAYGLPAMIRPHPRAIERQLWRGHRKQLDGSLADALSGAAVVITWNSNSAVDAVLAGVPAVTIDPGAMAWPVTGRRIGDLARPDRAEWANRVSWCQWSPDELESGVWWDRMKAGL